MTTEITCIKRDYDLLLKLNWINKRTFSTENVRLYNRAYIFKQTIKTLLNELIYNSDKSYLIHMRKKYCYELNLIYSTYLNYIFSLEFKKSTPDRYVFNIKSIVNLLNTIKGNYSFMPQSGFYQVYEKIHDEHINWADQ